MDLEQFKLVAATGELVGIFDNIPNEVYHSLKNYVSSSGLAQFKKSPAHFRAYVRGSFEPTVDQEIGIAVHQRVIEPELFLKCNALGPDVATRASKEWKSFEAANPGKKCWKPAEWDRIVCTADNILNHPKFGPMLLGAKREQTLLWIDPETGTPCRCRPDLLLSDGLCPDIKTTKDASPQSFSWTLVDYAYAMKQAFYLEGVYRVLKIEQNTGILIAAEKTDPYAVQPYVLAPDEKFGVDPMEQGRREYRKYLNQYADCLKSNQWPAYSEEFLPLSLPSSENYRLSEEVA